LGKASFHEENKCSDVLRSRGWSHRQRRPIKVDYNREHIWLFRIAILICEQGPDRQSHRNKTLICGYFRLVFCKDERRGNFMTMPI
jgi:hypothetical protein